EAEKAEEAEAPVVGGDVIMQVPTFGAQAQPEVLGERITRARPEAAPEVKGKAVLPFTGGNVASLLVLALGLMTTGGLLLRFRSR
ncbi:MAG: LPXTG cell wall anchor domain-containing protein, partial [Actinomycetota bacterium]